MWNSLLERQEKGIIFCLLLTAFDKVGIMPNFCYIATKLWPLFLKRSISLQFFSYHLHSPLISLIHLRKYQSAQCSKTALPPTKSPRLATVCAKKLKFGLKTPCATLMKGTRSNLGSFPVWTGNGPNSCLISRKIVQIWTVRDRKLKFGLKTPYA